jgi:FkbM family methyltransferase
VAVRANAKIHNADIRVVNCALGKTAGTAGFTYYPHNTVMSTLFADTAEDHGTLHGFLMTKAPGEKAELMNRLVTSRLAPDHRECAVITLNQLVDDEGLECIDLLKIDVEKAELDVLAGISDETWIKVRQVVIEVHDIAGRVADILGMLQRRGFTTAHDRDPRLADTSCFTVYGWHEPDDGEGNTGAHSRQPGWSGRKRLTEALVKHMKERLPDRLVPERVVLVATLPPTGNRKGVHQLEESVPTALRGSITAADHGQTSTEALLVAEFREILNVSLVDGNSDFFALGGDSLRGMRLIARVESALGENVLPPDTLFEDGQLRRLAAEIDARLRERVSESPRIA